MKVEGTSGGMIGLRSLVVSNGWAYCDGGGLYCNNSAQVTLVMCSTNKQLYPIGVSNRMHQEKAVFMWAPLPGPMVSWSICTVYPFRVIPPPMDPIFS